MDDIDRTFEMIDVIDFHLKHTDQFKQTTREKLEKYVLNKLDENPDYLFEASSPFRTVYPNLFKCASDTEYYHLVIDKMFKHFTDSKDELVVLQRLEQIIAQESSVQHYETTLKLLALC
jgi:hypothetical protein